jgi:hypothetical protein
MYIHLMLASMYFEYYFVHLIRLKSFEHELFYGVLYDQRSYALR